MIIAALNLVFFIYGLILVSFTEKPTQLDYAVLILNAVALIGYLAKKD